MVVTDEFSIGLGEAADVHGTLSIGLATLWEWLKVTDAFFIRISESVDPWLKVTGAFLIRISESVDPDGIESIW